MCTDDRFEELREIEIQWSDDTARASCIEDGSDEDGSDFETHVAWEQGDSTEIIMIDSWNDIPQGYEPVDPTDAQEYEDYLESREWDDYLEEQEDSL